MECGPQCSDCPWLVELAFTYVLAGSSALGFCTGEGLLQISTQAWPGVLQLQEFCFPYRVLFISMFWLLLRAWAWWLLSPAFLEPLMGVAVGAKQLDLLRIRLLGLLSYAQTVSGNTFCYKSEKKWGKGTGNISGQPDCEYRYLADPVCFQYWNYFYSIE